jgi:beta-glucosidase
VSKLPKRTPIVAVAAGDGPFSFPNGFLWGAATADQQIEGQQASDWTAFEQRAHHDHLNKTMPDGHPMAGNIAGAGTVPSSWFERKTHFDERMTEDIAAAAAMGHNAHRFSISWARLFPRPNMNEPDAAGLAYYDRLFALLAQHQLQPVVTLFHFASPAWLWSDEGGKRGVERADAVSSFARFAAVVASRWGKHVKLWCTLNEPMVWTYLAYAQGLFPPLEQRAGNAALTPVVVQLLRMHVAAVQEIRKHSAAPVGIAQHTRNFLPLTNGLHDRAAAYFVRRAFMFDFLDAIESGTYQLIGSLTRTRIPDLRGSQDYVGTNYYGRFYCSVRYPQGLVTIPADPNTPREETNDLGWCLDEAGFVDVLKQLHDRYGKPMYVLENGIADASDAKRPSFLVRHAHAIWEACRLGADVRGYFHWSLMDNFEWAEGFDPKFGLRSVDYSTGIRGNRGSAAIFADIANPNTISAAQWAAHRRR